MPDVLWLQPSNRARMVSQMAPVLCAAPRILVAASAQPFRICGCSYHGLGEPGARQWGSVCLRGTHVSPRRFQAACASAGAAFAPGGKGVEAARKEGACIVWFKHDLRTDDHPGLLAAATQYDAIVPVYIFDPVLLAGWSSSVLEALHDAVVYLQRALQVVGSDLLIRVGSSADAIAELAQQTGARDIFFEEEVEETWQEVVWRVRGGLSTKQQGELSVSQWTASLYEDGNVTSVNFKDFEKSRVAPSRPIDPPTSLPRLPKGVDKGTLPSLEEVYSWTRTNTKQGAWSPELESPESILNAEGGPSNGSSPVAGPAPFRSLLEWREKYILASPYAALEQSKLSINTATRTEGYVITGGAAGAANALSGYLRFLEPTARDDWQRMYESIWALESRPGASFRSLFGSALGLGTLSLRRVYHEAVQYEKDRLGGRLSPFGFSTFTVAAAVSDAKSIEWYQRLAKNSQAEGQAIGLAAKTWKWRNFLVQYTHAGKEGPAVVLLHGFGAFWEHYRDNVQEVANKGNRVWALTLLGFGRSEKPNVKYTELFWSELVRDFIAEVVGEPVVLAGNSIGGYTVSVVAGLWPQLVKSLVLISPAGKVVPNYQGVKYGKPRSKSQLAWAGARLLMLYLQNSSNKLLRRCYPVNTARADDWLAQEVTRASYDPGAITVLESIFFLQAPLPVNFFLDRFSGKVLVIQGAKDPLSNSPLRASLLKAHCKNVTVKILDAGHCPHDEVPDQVNSILQKWIRASPADFKSLDPDDSPPHGLQVDNQTVATGDLITEVVQDLAQVVHDFI